MTYSISSEALIQGSLSELAGPNRPYSVVWTEDRDLQGWTTFINLDVVGVWNGFLFGTKLSTSGGFIGPTDTFLPLDSLVNGHIFFRLKYDKHPKNPNPTSYGKIQWTTTSDPLFNEDKSITFPLNIDGKWHLYDLDMNQASKWVGLINKVRFFPCEDGYINDEFFLTFFEIGTNDFDFALTNPAAGVPGRLMGGEPMPEEITITKNVNDKLLVNIDGYGYVSITLNEQTGTGSTIARDIAIQLGKISIGGYVRAQTSLDEETNNLIIESGTRDEDSSVSILNGENSAAFTLGLTNSVGEFIGIITPGAPPALGYVPLSDYRPKTIELLALFDNDNVLPAFSLDPKTPTLEGGRRNFALSGQRLKTDIVIEGRGTPLQSHVTTNNGSLDGEAKTFIDLNHPFTDDGFLSHIFFNGISDPDGGTKWKIFRPLLDGTLTLIQEGVIGETNFTPNPSSGLVLTTSPGVFEVNVSTQNIKVRQGDLLAIYNAGFHVGQAGPQKPDALYYEISGDAIGTITPPSPSGAGESGLPIYAVGFGTKARCAIDIDLRRRLNLDKIKIIASESERNLEYNLASASTASFSADIFSTHIICRPSFFSAPCFDRPNVAFNIQALNDNVIYAVNGVTSFGDGGDGGIAGADVDGATYFYVNGDAEQLHTFDYPSFPVPVVNAYGFERDPLGLTCFFSGNTPRTDKPVSKAVIYFKDRKNQRSWQIEYARSFGSKGGNGSIPGFQLIPEETIQAVTLDDSKKIARSSGLFLSQKGLREELLLGNPVILDVIAKDGTRNPQQGVDFKLNVGELGGTNLREQATFIDFQWTKFQWEFDPVRTTAFRWYTDYHFSTKISEFQIFASSLSREDLGDNTQVLFSVDGQTFASAGLISATGAQAEYKIGNSPQFIRLIFRPTLDLTLKDIKFFFEEDQVLFGPEGRTGSYTYLDDSRVGSIGATNIVPITNNTGETADLILDISPDVETSKQLLYFSHLHSKDDITTPQVGPPGRVDFVPDKRLGEEENVAINAKAYGLNNLSTASPQAITDNLLVSGAFETGDLTGWNLTVTQSGTQRYQIPRVMNVVGPENLADEGPNPDESLTPEFQGDNYLFGFECDSNIPTQAIEVPIHFVLESDVIDVSEFSDSIDLGSSEVELAFRYMSYFTPNDNTSPFLNVMGSPTASGIALPENSIVNSSYGTNRLRSKRLVQGLDTSTQTDVNNQISVTSWKSSIKQGTRFIKIQFVVNADSARLSGSRRTMKFFLDDVDVHLFLPSPAGVKWYKSWRTGSGDFTDAQYAPVTEFTTITGSTHWYQPWNNSAGATPVAGQSLGFSNVFSANRLSGAQSFRRMSITDPGILGAQWSGEKVIEGFRAVFNHNPSSPASISCGYPRRWHVEVLKTKAELGGIDPDIENDAHFKMAMIYTNTGPWDPTATLRAEASTASEAPAGLVLTWLFDTPQTTEGLRVVFTTNCDRFEIPPFDTNSDGQIALGELPAFIAATTCLANITSVQFFCLGAIGASFFQPLESVGLTNLPVDNVRIANRTGNVFAAVDLGRKHNIDTNSDLFEIVAQTTSQSEWGVNLVSFSNTNTDNPNSVVWGGGSADARWIRFGSASTEKYEDPAVLEQSSFSSNTQPAVVAIPQSFILEARIYPILTQYLIPLDGYNSSWTALGTVITDNNNVTSINYRNYPVIALDLGKSYLLDNEGTIFRKKHEFVTNTLLAPGDRQYWDATDDSNFTYAKRAFSNEDNPARIEFSPFGAAVPPDISIRWVAFKGSGPLKKAGNVTGPKTYNFNTQGQVLYNSSWKPRNSEVFTENANWFTTNRVGLNDISTISTVVGSTFTATKGVDYGPLDGRDFIGDVYNAFDGVFDPLEGDIWGVATRDPVTGISKDSLSFPHHIFRTFRDNFRGAFLAKDVKGIKITGYNAFYYPTAFHVQKIKDSVFLPNAINAATRNAVLDRLRLSTTWETIADSTVTDIDSYQEGAGYILLFALPVNTRGIRIVIDASAFPDDEDQTVTQEPEVSGEEIRGSKTFLNISGPQTRVSEIVIYEEQANIPTIEGQIDINQASSATITTLTQVPDKNPSRMIDRRLSTDWQSTGFQDTITISLPAARDVHRLEWELDPSVGKSSGNANRNAPRNFRLTAQQGPIEVTVLTVQDFVGTSYSGDLLNAPVNSDFFKLYITRVQGEANNSDSIQISELRLIEEIIQATPLVVAEDVTDRHPDNSPNVRSTLIRYAANTDAEAELFLDGIDANNDTLWSERDFFQLYLKINDIALLDTSYGAISLGNSTDVLYQWNISDIPDLHSGWNRVRLQFKSAANRTEIPFQGGPKFDPRFGDSKVDFMTADSEFLTAVHGVTGVHVIQSPGIRYFSIAFRGTKAVPDKELELTLDDFVFSRNRFDDVCKFQTSLYLNNSETMIVNLEGLDMSIGTLEFWIQPDWDKSARIRSRPAAFSSIIIPTIFRILRADGTFLSLFYRPSTGFVSLIYDGEQILEFENNNRSFDFNRFEPFHFALVWDTFNLKAGTSASSLAMYFNGKPIFGSTKTWRALKQSGSTILFGGEMGQRVAASPHNSTSLTFTPVSTLPAKNTASAWALLENVKLYNYPKINFDDRFDADITRTNIISPSELIQISKDGINFESVGSINLPLVIEDVPSDGAVNLYMRSNIPKGMTGEENRDASIIVRWKTPMRTCD